MKDMQKKIIEPMDSLDIVVSIYNQEHLMERVLGGIFVNTTTPFNLILIFDGCSDKSEEKALAYIKRNRPALLQDLRTTTSPNVYEAKANNIGFRMATEKYIITVQDDMVIQEKGWERRLTFPIRIYNDIFAVTARGTMNMIIDDSSADPQYFDLTGREYMNLRRNTFAIRSVINRGPIAFRADTLKKLNYFDEAFAPGGQLDDADMSLRAYQDFGMKCGAFWIDYRSDMAWGKSRMPASPNRPNWTTVLRRNAERIREKMPQFVSGEFGIRENRRIEDSEIDYLGRDPVYSRIQKWIARNTWFLWTRVARKANGLRVRIHNLSRR